MSEFLNIIKTSASRAWRDYFAPLRAVLQIVGLQLIKLNQQFDELDSTVRFWVVMALVLTPVLLFSKFTALVLLLTMFAIRYYLGGAGL